MQDGPSIPELVRVAPSEYGYESPTEISSNRADIEKDRGKRRHGYFHNTDHIQVASMDTSKVSDAHGTRNGESEGIDEPIVHKTGLRARIGCYTWTWFTMTMATGGMANVLHSIPYRSDWLYRIGAFFFIFNVCLFVVNCVMITLRFQFNTGSFRASFTSQAESLFIPASIVSVGTILINISQYGLEKQGPWLQKAMEILFWIYAAVSMLASSGIYLILWSTQQFPIHNMTPIWIFPAYPLLLSAPLAANLIDALPSAVAASEINSIAMAFGALTLQGTGFLVSLNIYGAFIYRLMTQKLPRDTLKPGMFVSVGPSGFTAAGLVHLGNVLSSKVLPAGFMGLQDAALFMKLLLDVVSLWLWGLCIWFFFVSVGAHWKILWPKDPKHSIRFNMTWYSFVFPNTAFVTATQGIGRALDSNAIQVVGTVMAGILLLVWLSVFCAMIRALVSKRLLWPEEDQQDNAVRGVRDRKQ